MCLMVQDSNNLDTEDLIIFTNLLARFDDLAFSYSFMIIISKVMTSMKQVKMFPNSVRYGSMSHAVNGIGSKSGCGFK